MRSLLASYPITFRFSTPRPIYCTKMKWLAPKLTRLQPFQVGRIENFKVSQLEMAVTWSILEIAFSSYNCASDMRADFGQKVRNKNCQTLSLKDEKSQKLYQISAFLS